MVTSQDRPTTLLESLCRAHNRQGGTIHQYNLALLRWECHRKPSVKRNTEGLYYLQYYPEGFNNRESAVCLAYVGGPSIAIIRSHFPITAHMPGIAWTGDRSFTVSQKSS